MASPWDYIKRDAIKKRRKKQTVAKKHKRDIEAHQKPTDPYNYGFGDTRTPYERNMQYFGNQNQLWGNRADQWFNQQPFAGAQQSTDVPGMTMSAGGGQSSMGGARPPAGGAMQYYQPWQNPYQNQLGSALRGMENTGFDPNQLRSFVSGFNPAGGQQPTDRPQMVPFAPGVQPPAGARQPTDVPRMTMSAGGAQPFAGGGRPHPMLTSAVQPSMGGGRPGGQFGLPSPPTMERPTAAERFAGGTSNVRTPGMGMGGFLTNQLFQQGTQQPGQVGYNPDVGQARSAQLSGLLGQAGGGGITGEQRQQLFSAEFDPVKQALGEARQQALTGLSARGMGRGSEGVGNVEDAYMNRLSNAAQQIGAGLTGRDIDLGQRQAEFGLSGLGGYAGQGMEGTLGLGGLQNQMLGTANQYNLGLGGLGSEMAGQTAANQRWQQEQQFGQNAARAGMSGDLASARNQEMLERYGLMGDFGLRGRELGLRGRELRERYGLENRALDEQIAARQAGNLLDTMGYGMRAQGMQNTANQGLVDALLGAGGQNLAGYGASMGALGDLYGMDQAQNQFMGNLLMDRLAGTEAGMMGGVDAQLRAKQFELQRQKQAAAERAAQRGGGVGGALAGMAGTVAGSMFGPVGAAAGGQLAGSLFGGGGQTGGYTMPSGYGLPLTGGRTYNNPYGEYQPLYGG